MRPLKSQSIIVLPYEQAFIFDQCSTRLRVEDGGAGPYLVIDQPGSVEEGAGEVAIDFADWPAICKAVRRLRKEWDTPKPNVAVSEHD